LDGLARAEPESSKLENNKAMAAMIVVKRATMGMVSAGFVGFLGIVGLMVFMVPGGIWLPNESMT